MTISTGSRDIKDTGWIRQAILVPGRNAANARNQTVRGAQRYTPGSLEFADTSLGGNKSINPKPQFTKNADPSVKSLLANTSDTGQHGSGRATSLGMGRYYGEAIDAREQRIYMQFGLQRANSLTNFFGGFYSTAHGNLANLGQATGMLENIQKFIGYVIMMPITVVLGGANLIYRGLISGVANVPLSKFYTMAPTMSLYWSTVTNIVNAMAVNMELIPGVQPDEIGDGTDGGLTAPPLSESDNEAMQRLLPDIMKGNGGIDIKAVATRYQRLADAHQDALRSFYDVKGGKTEEEVQADIQAYINKPPTTYSVPDADTMRESMDKYVMSESSTLSTLNVGALRDDAPLAASLDRSTNSAVLAKRESDAAALALAERRAAQASSVNTITSGRDAKNSWWFGEFWDKNKDYMRAEMNQGSNYISFIVNPSGSPSESFANSSKPSDIASSMNQISSNARSKIYNMAGGNLGDGVVASALEGVISGVKSVVEKTADIAGISGLTAMGGKAFIDMPEFWESASVTMPTVSYTIELRTPYGNPMSILQTIMVPFACLLAGAAPRSTGKASYTSPYLCKIWDQGKNQIALGMIDSLTITRQTGNLGYSNDFQATGIDMTFSVVNLSKMLHIPISSEASIFDALGFSIFDEDSNFTDYMATVAGLSMHDQNKGMMARWRLRTARARANLSSKYSVSNMASNLFDTRAGNLLQRIVGGYGTRI